MKNLLPTLVVLALLAIGPVSCTKDADAKPTGSTEDVRAVVPMKAAPSFQLEVDTLNRIPVNLVVN